MISKMMTGVGMTQYFKNVWECIEVFRMFTSNSGNFDSARSEEKFALDYPLIENTFRIKIYRLF